jgi:hypothetical protein
MNHLRDAWVAEFEGLGEDYTRDSLHAGLFDEEKGILHMPGSTLRERSGHGVRRKSFDTCNSRSLPRSPH